MTYMIIETFKPWKVKEIYQRLEEKGRIQPKVLTYINSWINEKLEKVLQDYGNRFHRHHPPMGFKLG
jgi:hypothetical protein